MVTTKLKPIKTNYRDNGSPTCPPCIVWAYEIDKMDKDDVPEMGDFGIRDGVLYCYLEHAWRDKDMNEINSILE